MGFGTWAKFCAKWVWNRLDKPVPALPVDLFRIGAGVLSVAYFYRTYREIDAISSSEGIIDHDLVREMYPYTRIGFFPPKATDRFFRVAYLAAIASSISVAMGVKVRPNSLFLYLTAVSAYRRNFLTLYIDDAMMHLVYFWLILLPTGQTLTIDKRSRRPWRTSTVPGFTVRAFIANLSLIYLAAGLWKWTSPLWRQGVAVYATLKIPLSYAPKLWSPRIQPLLAPANHAAILLEPILSIMSILPTGSRIKYGLGGGMIAFHLGIIGTLRVPYANIACLATLPLWFRDELMEKLGVSADDLVPTTERTSPLEKTVSTTFLMLLLLANLWRINERIPLSAERPPLRAEYRRPANVWQALLWLMGIAQSYRLMDWIDDLNWHIYYEGQEVIAGEIHPFDTDNLFPKAVRYIFLYSYIQDRSWRPPPTHYLADLQASLLKRFVQQFANNFPNTGQITVYTIRGRITRDNIGLHETERFKLLQFSVENGTPTIEFMHLTAKE